LENIICKAGNGRGENAECEKILENSLSGDHSEEGKVSTPKEVKGTHELESIKGESS
jgi:hypothetical protein